MKIQTYLKQQRQKLNLSITAVALQTSLSKELIKVCENPTAELDRAALFILQEHYFQLNGGGDSNQLLSYDKWLTQLNQRDQILLKERTIGIADSFKYRRDSIRELAPEKIILTTGLEIHRKTGSLTYHAPTGTIFNYKIYPKSDQIERSKKLSALEQAVMLYFNGIGFNR